MSYLKKVEKQRALMLDKMKSKDFGALIVPDRIHRKRASESAKKYRRGEGIPEYKPLGEGEKSGLRKIWDDMTSHLKKEKPKKADEVQTTPKG